MLRRPPRAELEGAVIDIVGYRENGRALSGQVEMATLVVPLIISFGAPFNIALGRAPTAEDRWGSFTSGLFAGHVVIDSAGAAECIQIDFTPLGAWRFFGMPMSELTGRMVATDDLGDRAIEELRRRLADEPEWDRRLDLAGTFVLARLRQSVPADPAIEWALAAIAASKGQLRIEKLAERLDWSRKHLARRFNDAIGLPPKALARMIRFHNAVATARAETDADWAGIAAACGYADQAHLTRDFLEFSGTTPNRWRHAA
ncbi:MAG: helix-turn-helix domain-containing protein [Rhizobiaceae bacterium]